MCHRMQNTADELKKDDRCTPHEPVKANEVPKVEPLPEATRERRDGPGGE